MSRWAVILAGGVGSRFWPLSTPERPKQLLPLVGDRPLLVESAARLAPLVPPERTLVLTNGALAPRVRALLPELPADHVIAEPRPAGTAPALTWAAVEIARRDSADAVMLSVHADWAIADAARFRDTLARAADLATREHALVTVGVVPARPDPGFGYVRAGAPADGARHVAEFVEKPSRAEAERLIAEGALWNSGIFAWRVGDFLVEVRAHASEVAPALLLAERGELTSFFERVRPVSVDVGVLERSQRVLVIPGDFGWDDVGTWAALARVRQTDTAGNAIAGEVWTIDAHDNVVHAEGGRVVVYGVDGLVVVRAPSVTLVTTVERAADLKTLLEQLPPELRDRP